MTAQQIKAKLKAQGKEISDENAKHMARMMRQRKKQDKLANQTTAWAKANLG